MGSLVPASTTASLARLERQTRTAISRTEQHALQHAAKLQAVGFVSQVGLFQISGLSNMEAELTKMTPLAADRLKAIVDTATGAIAAEVAGVVWE